MSKLLGFDCVNEEKVDRAVLGTPGRDGKLVGGVGDNASEEVKLAAYDKLGGKITKGIFKVKSGCFFDFEKKVAFKKPVVILESKGADGLIYEFEDGDDVPFQVQLLQGGKEKKGRKRVRVERKKSKKSDDEE